MTISRQTPRMLPLELLVEHQKNVRTDVGDIAELAASIRQHGVIQPIVVTEHPTRSGMHLVLAGHRRLAAARSVGLEQLPCIIRHDAGTRSDHVALMLVENMQRAQLTAVEKARAMQTLIDAGMTQSDVARRLGITPASVNTYIMLLDLSAEDLEQIEAGEVKLGDARAAIKQARQLQRRAAGHADRGRPAHTEPPYFNPKHPLAADVKTRCDHTTRPKVGSSGCGQCWEQAIRDDEYSNVQDIA